MLEGFDMFGYRKIERIEMGKTVCNDPGEPPEMVLLRPDQLAINEEYQRSLSRSSLAQIKRMAAEFDWGKYKALNVAPTDVPGVYEVTDGQHTAIAAKTNGLVPFLPSLVSKSFTLREKAEDFVGINTQRLSLTPMAIFNAKVAAQDDDAIAVQCAMDRAGVTLLAVPPTNKVPWKVGETIAVATMTDLVRKAGEGRLATVLRIAVLAKAAPVSALLMRAVHAAAPADASAEDRAAIVGALVRLGVGRLEVTSKAETPPGRRAFETMADKIAAAAGIARKGKKAK